MERMVNYYEILGLPIEASEDDIKREIQQKRKQFTAKTTSPKREIRQEAETKIEQISEAQKTLLKKDKRSEYDQKLKIWLASQPKQSANSASQDVYDSGQDLVAMGWDELNQGNIPNALHMATQATIRDGLNADAWALLGEANCRWGEIDDGVSNYLRAVKLRPNDAGLYFSLGCLYEDQEKWQEAYKQYDRASTIEPNTTLYRASKALVQVKTGQYDEGISVLRECISAEPDNKTYQWYLAIAYMRSVYEGWVHLPEDIVIGKDNVIGKGYWAINRKQVVLAQERISAAQILEFDDPQLASDIDAANKDISRMLERKFEGNIKFAVIASLPWLFLHGVGLALGPAYFFAARAPQYALNRRILFEAGVLSEKDNKMLAASMAGQNVMDKLLNFARSSADRAASSNDSAVKALALLPALMALGLITALLPVVTIYYFVKNYTGENAPTKSTPSPGGMPENVPLKNTRDQLLESEIIEVGTESAEHTSQLSPPSPSSENASRQESPPLEGRSVGEKQATSASHTPSGSGRHLSSLITNKLLLAGVGVLLLFLVGGGYYFQHRSGDVRLEDLAKREADIKEQQDKLAKERQAVERAMNSAPPPSAAVAPDQIPQSPNEAGGVDKSVEQQPGGPQSTAGMPVQQEQSRQVTPPVVKEARGPSPRQSTPGTKPKPRGGDEDSAMLGRAHKSLDDLLKQ